MHYMVGQLGSEPKVVQNSASNHRMVNANKKILKQTERPFLTISTGNRIIVKHLGIENHVITY